MVERNAGQRLNAQSVLSHKSEFSESPYTPSVVWVYSLRLKSCIYLKNKLIGIKPLH